MPALYHSLHPLSYSLPSPFTSETTGAKGGCVTSLWSQSGKPEFTLIKSQRVLFLKPSWQVWWQVWEDSSVMVGAGRFKIQLIGSLQENGVRRLLEKKKEAILGCLCRARGSRSRNDSSEHHSVLIFTICCVLFCFVLRFYLFIHGRHTERGRRRSRLLAGSLMQNSIPGPWDHDLSQGQMLNCWATQATPPVWIFFLKMYLFIYSW